MTPTVARMVLGCLLALLLAGLSLHVPEQPTGKTKEQHGDGALFATVVQRVSAGESYYAAMGAELRQRGYPTASVFNWRAPLLLRTVAAAPRLTRLLLLGLALSAVLATVLLLNKARLDVLLVAVLLQVGVAVSIFVFSDSVTLAELWTGFLILISIAAYARPNPWVGVAFGMLALFVRELAAPYCLVCGIVALWHRRWTELGAWTVGAGLYAVYYVMHINSVAAHVAMDAQPRAWIEFGGLPFVLGTIRFSGWFALPGVAAIGLVLILAALWSRAPLHLRATAVAYLAFFTVIGQNFNQNWGLVAAPTWALACGYGIDGVRRLARAAIQRQDSQGVQQTPVVEGQGRPYPPRSG